MAEQVPASIQDKCKKFIIQFKKAARRAERKLNTFHLPFGDITVKTAGKLAITAAALLSVGLLIFAGADLSPAAISRGVRDKRALLGATGEGYPLDINGSRAISVGRLSKGTALLTDTTYTVLDQEGKEVLSEAHYMATPMMKTADRYTLLLDRKSTIYTLKTLSGTLCSGKTQHPIITGDVSRAGRFAIVTMHDTANAYIYVFSKTGAVLHKWKSSTYHISDISINPSGNLIAMCGVTTTDDGLLQSCVIIQKVGAHSNLREYVFDDNLIFAVHFTDSDSVAFIGDNMAGRVSAGSERKLTYPYDGRTLGGYDISDNGSVALALSQHSDGQNMMITVLNGACRETLRLETDLTSPVLELTNNRVNLLGPSEFYSYSLGGNRLKTVDVPADSQSVLTSCGRILIKGVSTITKVD